MKRLNLLLLVVLVSGCGPKYTVSGKVMRGGKPIEWHHSEDRLLLVHFAPVDRDSNRALYPAKTNAADGTYTITGLPAGSYLVAVHIWDPHPKVETLNYAYTLAKSPLRFEVTGNCEHNIDLPADAPRQPKGPKGAKAPDPTRTTRLDE
jgi:hypothetical protein